MASVPARSGRQREFEAYMLAARQRLLRAEVATAQQVRALYRRVAEQIRRDVEAVTAADSLRRRHLEALLAAIERRAQELRDELLRIATTGIRVGAGLPAEAAQEFLFDVAGGVLRQAGIRALFADVHERAVLATLSRTLGDGLRLSDRVWRQGDQVRNAITAIIEDAVARGEDPRRTARLLQQYLLPGAAARPLREETRRRMRVPANVAHGALRLAVTELHHAYHEASVATYQVTPGILGVAWRLSNAHVVPDICDEYAARPYWPTDQVPPKPHPWCRCFTVPVTEPVDQFVDRLRRWVDDPASEPDIDAWHRRFAGLLGAPAAEARRSTRARAPRVPAELATFWQAVRAGSAMRDQDVEKALDALLAETRRQIVDPLLEQTGITVREVEENATAGVFRVRLGWTAWVGGRAVARQAVLGIPARSQQAFETARAAAERLRQATTVYDRIAALRELYAVATGTREAWHREAAGLFRQLGAWDSRVMDALWSRRRNPSPSLDILGKLVWWRGGQLPQRLRAQLELGEDFLRRMVEGPLPDAVGPLRELRLDDQGRAFYRPRDRRMQLYEKNSNGTPSNLAEDIAHEFGHHLHDQAVAVLQLVDTWFGRRLAGPLGTVRWQWSPTDFGWEDLFINKYVGRDYQQAYRGLEVISMGLENIYNSASWFLFVDPDHATLVLGLVKGVGAR